MMFTTEVKNKEDQNDKVILKRYEIIGKQKVDFFFKRLVMKISRQECEEPVDKASKTLA